MRSGIECHWLSDLMTGGLTLLRFIVQYAGNWSSDFLTSIDLLI
jgi:hypothetical protein